MRWLGRTLAMGLGLPALACTPATGPSAPEAPVTAGSQQTIIDGTPARANQVMSTLALVDPGSGEFFCTGTLVTPTVVITAAHCLMTPAQDGFIQADDAAVGVDVLDARRVPANKRVDIERFTVHPNFAQGPRSNDPSGLGRDDDIAVLVLSRPVAALQPTPILPGDLLGSVDNARLTISGYGVNDMRNEAAGVLHIGETRVVRQTEHEVLAGGGDDADTCFGDSGGPAYLEVNGTRYLVGATSRGAEDTDVDCGDRGIYTLVPAYRDWIDEVIAGGPAADAPGPDLGGGPGGGEGGDWPEDEGDWPEGEGDWPEGDGEGDGIDGVDVCAEEGFYDDGVCDPFCDNPDVDCDGQEGGAWGGEGEPGEDGDGIDGVDVCAEEGFYEDGVCDPFCDNPDADCEGEEIPGDAGGWGDEGDEGDEGDAGGWGDEGDEGDEGGWGDEGDEGGWGDEDLGDEDLGDEGDEGTDRPDANGDDFEPGDEALDGEGIEEGDIDDLLDDPALEDVSGCSATPATGSDGSGAMAMLLGLLLIGRRRFTTSQS